MDSAMVARIDELIDEHRLHHTSHPVTVAHPVTVESTTPEAVVPRSERVAQERLELKEWSKATPDSLRQDQSEDRVFPSQDHMNIEELMCEMGLHFLYDWEGVYTPEKRSEVIKRHADTYPCGLVNDAAAVDSVISELYKNFSLSTGLPASARGDVQGQPHLPTTFEQFEMCLPSNSLKNKLMRVINSTNHWGHTYVQTDKLEYINIATLLEVRDDYKFEEEESEEEGWSDEFNAAYARLMVMGPGGVWVEASDEEDSDEEDGMSAEERKGMCSKGLEIIETIMEKDDQRMGEGDFVELCNLLKELHRK